LLEVFSASPVRYVKTTGERHADNILKEKTSKQTFPSAQTITTKMQKQVQKFDTKRLLLSYVKGSVDVCKQWQQNLKFFCPTELEQKEQFSQLITQFKFSLAGSSMTASHGLVMQSDGFFKYLTVTKQLVDDEQIQKL
jgi:hypothetical protein